MQNAAKHVATRWLMYAIFFQLLFLFRLSVAKMLIEMIKSEKSLDQNYVLKTTHTVHEESGVVHVYTK